MLHLRNLIFFITVAILLPIQADDNISENHSETNISRIAFGACNNPRKNNPGMYEAILGEKPDIFVFLGDNIYGDTEDMEVLQKKYDELGALEDFQKLSKQSKVIATWDDHDYGVNDGGNTYTMREESEKIFLDFFNEPKDTARRTRPGVHTSYTFGAKGKTCQIIVLDTRYFRDVVPTAKYNEGERPENIVGWYRPVEDTSMTLLGEAQWEWLEQQLQVPANFRIIASSIQMIPFEKGMENWGNVPHEFDRLMGLLKKHKAHHTIGISGDVHFSEISRKTVHGYPFYDFTSSGMTHASAEWSKATNSFRIGKAYAQLNAGVIDLDWTNQSATLRTIDKAGNTVLKHKIPFTELRFE